MLVGEVCMMVFYEFLYCIVELLVDMVVIFGGECLVVLVCELIKLFEIVFDGDLVGLLVKVEVDEN